VDGRHVGIDDEASARAKIDSGLSANKYSFGNRSLAVFSPGSFRDTRCTMVKTMADRRGGGVHSTGKPTTDPVHLRHSSAPSLHPAGWLRSWGRRGWVRL